MSFSKAVSWGAGITCGVIFAFVLLWVLLTGSCLGVAAIGAKTAAEIEDQEMTKPNAENPTGEKPQKNKPCQIVILEKRFQVEKTSFGSQPTVHIEVKNEYKKAVSEIYFSAVLKSRGRTVPWAKGNFNYKIKGGLEPDEFGDWDLELNMFGDFGNLEPRDDYVFDVTVKEVTDHEGKKLYP